MLQIFSSHLVVRRYQEQVPRLFLDIHDLHLQLDLLTPGVLAMFDVESEMVADPRPARIKEVSPDLIYFKNLMKEISVISLIYFVYLLIRP